MNADSDSASPTNKIAFYDKCHDQGIPVPVLTIDQAADFGVPAFIKIDVEGFEWHVVQGAVAVLGLKDLRYVFVEIHFALLVFRGLSMAGDLVRKALDESGFKSEFTDFSHLCASLI